MKVFFKATYVKGKDIIVVRDAEQIVAKGLTGFGSFCWVVFEFFALLGDSSAARQRTCSHNQPFRSFVQSEHVKKAMIKGTERSLREQSRSNGEVLAAASFMGWWVGSA